MESWSSGVLGKKPLLNTTRLQHSNLPSVHCSNTPTLQHSNETWKTLYANYSA